MANQDQDRSDFALSHMANASVGLFGVQVVWGLQSVATSRVFQSLGAEMADLPLLWIAAPLTGLLVHPLVGWLSDRTRSPWGRRRPYIAGGAVLTAASMVLMGGANSLPIAVTALWLLTLSVNVAMQPMRSLIADIAPKDQLNRAYAVQVLFIGAGAVFASCLPWMLARLAVIDVQPSSAVTSWRQAFLIGAVAFLVTVGWTLIRTREPRDAGERAVVATPIVAHRLRPALWLAIGVAVAVGAALLNVRREVYLLAGILVLYGMLEIVVLIRRRNMPSRPITGLLEIVQCIAALPVEMRRLAKVQFFTWFALFTVWVYAVPAVAARQYDNALPGSPAYEAAADWVGVLFGVQDAVAMLGALLLPRLARRIGLGACHAVCLAVGTLSFLSMTFMPGAGMLMLPWAGVGVAWASILSLPYSIVAAAGPSDRIGVYLGVHNIFLVLPQLVGASVLGLLVQRLFQGQAALILPLAAASFFVAALLSLRLPGRDRTTLG